MCLVCYSVEYKCGASFNILDDDGNVLCDADGQPLELKATDTVERTLRHLNFFQYKTFLHARVPKVHWNGKCPQVSVPWARKHSGFTLLFEAMVLEYAKHMTVSVHARLVNENDKRLWKIIKHYKEEAKTNAILKKTKYLWLKNASSLLEIGTDEEICSNAQKPLERNPELLR